MEFLARERDLFRLDNRPQGKQNFQSIVILVAFDINFARCYTTWSIEASPWRKSLRVQRRAGIEIIEPVAARSKQAHTWQRRKLVET